MIGTRMRTDATRAHPPSPPPGGLRTHTRTHSCMIDTTWYSYRLQSLQGMPRSSLTMCI